MTRRRGATCPFLLVPLLFALLLPSCSARVTSVDRDPSFQEEQFERSTVAVAGVVSLLPTAGTPIEQANRMSVILEDRIRRKNKRIELIPWGETRRALGDDAMELLLTESRDHGSLSAETIVGLMTALGEPVTHAVICRIEQDQLKQGESEVRTLDSETNTWNVTSIKYETTRITTASFLIYDLPARKIVWRGTIEGKLSTNKSDRVKSGDGDTGFFDFLAGVFLSGAEEGLYPAPPTAESVLSEVFDRFVAEVSVD